MNFITQQIDQASLGLSREYLIKKLEEPFVQAYHDYQVDLAVLMSGNRTRTELEMRAALDFEIELAEVNFYSKAFESLKKAQVKHFILDFDGSRRTT